jgi:YHS domain-containing protein
MRDAPSNLALRNLLQDTCDSVERDRAVTGHRDGESYYFCSAGCMREFLESPEAYVNNAAFSVASRGS